MLKKDLITYRPIQYSGELKIAIHVHMVLLIFNNFSKWGGRTFFSMQPPNDKPMQLLLYMYNYSNYH